MKKIKNFKLVHPNAKSKLRSLSNARTLNVGNSVFIRVRLQQMALPGTNNNKIYSSLLLLRPSDRRRVLDAARPCVYPPRHRRRRPTQTTFIFVPVHPTRTAAPPAPDPPSPPAQRAYTLRYGRVLLTQHDVIYVPTYPLYVRTRVYRAVLKRTRRIFKIYHLGPTTVLSEVIIFFSRF